MNLKQRLKNKRMQWRKMAKSNCKKMGIPFKAILTWNELPDYYKEVNTDYGVPYVVIHYGPGITMIFPMLKESDFTPVSI